MLMYVINTEVCPKVPALHLTMTTFDHIAQKQVYKM